MAGSSVLPACLPDPGEKFEAGYICTTCGWGRLNESKSLELFLNILVLLTLAVSVFTSFVHPSLANGQGLV